MIDPRTPKSDSPWVAAHRHGSRWLSRCSMAGCLATHHPLAGWLRLGMMVARRAVRRATQRRLSLWSMLACLAPRATQRRLALSLVAGWLVACHSDTDTSPGLIMRGFRLVDPATRSVTERDLVIENGRVAPAPSQGVDHTVVDGAGRYLLPALWDLKASLWGNNSTQNWDVLTQELGITQCLRVQLFYGVGHVVASRMGRDWVSRELTRATALEIDAAELLYPDKALCGEGAKEFGCHVVTKPEQVGPLLDDLQAKGISHLQIEYGAADSTPVALEVLAEILTQAKQRKLASYVFVDSWSQAAVAVKLGASAVHGLPEGELSDALVEQMAARHVMFAPALGLYLELPRLLGDSVALADPWLTQSADPQVLKSFEDPNSLWEKFRPLVERGKRLQQRALSDVARLAAASVPLLSATDAGWAGGTFQGYTSHAVQQWFERAGLQPWQRLAAATASPAQLLGRSVGFAPGAAADYVVLAEDPLKAAESLRSIRALVRDGRYVEREALRPDMTRIAFRP